MTDCLVRCNCHEVRLMTLAEMYRHMAEAHPAVLEGLGLAVEEAAARRGDGGRQGAACGTIDTN